jgi:hypothetical protein
MIKTRDQSLFDGMYKKISSLGYQVYDYKPLSDVGYPFVELESMLTNHDMNKSSVLGTVSLVASVWGLQKKRKQVSDMASNIFEQALQLSVTDSYSWALNTQASTIRMMDDTSTNTTLKRARITLEFELIGGI